MLAATGRPYGANEAGGACGLLAATGRPYGANEAGGACGLLAATGRPYGGCAGEKGRANSPRYRWVRAAGEKGRANSPRYRWVRAGKGGLIARATAGAGWRPGSFSLQRESLFLSLCRSLSIYLFLTLYLYLYLYLNLSLHTPGGNGNAGKKPCFSLVFGPAFEKRTAFFCGFAPGSTREAQGSCSNPGRNLQNI